MAERLAWANLIGTLVLAICFVIHVNEHKGEEPSIREEDRSAEKPVCPAPRPASAPKPEAKPDPERRVDPKSGLVYVKTVKAIVTAYEPSYRCCGRFADGKTATGTNAWRMDGCAVDPKMISYGHVVEIPGIGLRKADDTGPAMKRSARRGRYHVDVRMTYFYQARRWGRQDMIVRIYRRKTRADSGGKGDK
jgi:3D (Asp-Asp-Asp) domain-containing protein